MPFFKAKQIPFKEIPLFAITEHHAKLSLEILATMSQVCKVIQDLLSWIIESIDLIITLLLTGALLL